MAHATGDMEHSLLPGNKTDIPQTQEGRIGTLQHRPLVRTEVKSAGICPILHALKRILLMQSVVRPLRPTRQPIFNRRAAARPVTVKASQTKASRLFCFGLGYVGLGLAHYLRQRGWCGSSLLGCVMECILGTCVGLFEVESKLNG